ncbi:hypothetical protein DENSPDRAFT_927011 [Dentipellis sp. KUC8613]|nr:hypothetical protein DENSPDRAFT_927011 [Dentipellis sp. KUC8613]
MAGRRPAVSVSSVASSSAAPQSTKSESQGSPSLAKFRPPTSPWPPRSASIATLPSRNDIDVTLDPDELFTKYTISEVKGVQQRLRSDADAKQEELRLMVGARYRDLLQASTSIISIAKSSKRVVQALEEMRTSIPSPEEPVHLPKQNAVNGKDDSQLKVLQSLAAHMKLLLDTPEHLWRLIEKKKYLHAGWLFLLARVIHRALVREDAEDEENWKVHGIDVLKQFPLVQRQWDTVSQFRAQITYKATLYLREFSASVEDVCSVLLTLHLLESKPLSATLSTFLAQRSKTLQTSLARISKGPSKGLPPQALNGFATAKARKLVVREIRENIQSSLEVVSATVGTARRIFLSTSPDERPLIGRVLEFIQSDAPKVEDASIPPELQMSTQHLLNSLPSASHFQLLPQSVRFYKPFVDLTSSATSVSSDHLSGGLETWFQKAVQDLQNAAVSWFSDLHALREVWAIRMWLKKWVALNENLMDDERSFVNSVFDTLVRNQATEIWKGALHDTAETLKAELAGALSGLADNASDSRLDASPVDHLFQAPPTLSSFESSAGISTISSSFKKYESALRRQVNGRTPLLDKVMTSIESRAEALRKDFHAIRKAEGGDQSTLDWLSEAYRPDADQLCSVVIDNISAHIEQVADDSDISIKTLAFLARVTADLSTSPFLSNVCGDSTNGNNRFSAKARELHEQALDRWQKAVIKRVVAKYMDSVIATSKRSRAHSSNAPTSLPPPSTAVIQALLSLSHSLQNLGMMNEPLGRTDLVDSCLRHLVSTVLDAVTAKQMDFQGTAPLAICSDLKFLRKLAELWGTEWTKLSASLDAKAAQLYADSTTSSNHTLDDTPWDDVLRTQLLLAPLLPPNIPKKAGKDGKLSTLLPLGTPVVEQKVQPAMELVKPAPRFGLLLVGSSAVR